MPFSFLRVDRAGNTSKRRSATGFHFSRLGGTCPLRTVYAAFSAAGRTLTQVAEMPDGKRYFWVARTVSRGGHGHRAPRAEFAVALGCELRHAHRLVHAEGVALDDPGRRPRPARAAVSANAATAPSAPGPRPAVSSPSTRTGAPLCRIRWSRRAERPCGAPEAGSPGISSSRDQSGAAGAPNRGRDDQREVPAAAPAESRRCGRCRAKTVT